MRAVVVGASSGLGRCIAIECAVTEQTSVTSAIAKAAAQLGGIDALVYTPAIGPLARLVDTDTETWAKVFETNVTGAAITTAAAIPHLTESHGTALYLSSTSASVTPPLPGLGAYSVSKAALDRLVEAWRAENPDVGFTRCVVGDCPGGEGDAATEFPMASNWDFDLYGELHPVWEQRGLLAGCFIDVEDLVNAVDAVLRHGHSLATHSITLAPRPSSSGETQ
jgi:NAD(P)-dependent dehydrogenase (short-subunit alcohol dehydrogenase family)